MRTKAYVTGSRFVGAYCLILPEGLPAATRAEFHSFQHAAFIRFKAA